MAERPAVAALVLAAGRGERLAQAVPKAFVPLAGRTLVERSIRALAASGRIDRIVPVVAERDRAAFEALVPRLADVTGLAPAVVGGVERQDSMRAGLASLPPEIGWVAVHDAARCLVDPGDVARVIEAARSTGAAILGAPVHDTLKRVEGDRIVGTPDRRAHWAAQTPQVFRRDWLEAAIEAAARAGRLATDDAALVEAIGHAVSIVEARSPNPKITRPEDLVTARALLGAGGSMRIGQAIDVHALAAGRPLLLGGIEIPSERGLVGHSDGDALLHAVASAILGALGDGDLGRHFPSSDERFRGIASSHLLTHVVERMQAAGFRLGNLDATVVAQVPRLSPHQPAMQARVAALLGAAPERVNIKVSSTDALGAIGRGEGIAAMAIVLLEAEGARG